MMGDEGETTRRELWGWYFYAWGCEPFIVSAVGTYVPILLEQMARENGFKVDDLDTPCMAPDKEMNDPSITPITPPRATKCVVPFFGRYIDTSSLALYTFSLSVFVQTLVVISMSGAADRGKFRKKLLLGFAVIGAITTSLFIAVGSSRYYFASLLAVVSNSAFGAVSVCGNAYLPVLVNNHPLEKEGADEVEEEPLLDQGDDRVVPITERESEEQSRQRAQLSGKISGIGVAFGYLAAFIVQIGTFCVVKVTGSSTFSLRLAVFIVGIWWLVSQIPVSLLLRSRPGPPLPEFRRSHDDRKIGRWRMMWKYVKYGWRTLFATFKEARNMKDVAIFLLGWFIVSDAATTINSAAVLFAKTELNMSAPSLAIIGILVVFSGMAGAMTIPRYIQPQLDRISSKKLQGGANGIIFIVLVASVIPLYGILGFYLQSLGLRRPWEMYILAAWYGFALGGLNTTCRSVFSILIPKGKETTFFSLFSVTDKGSSVIGPAITGLITDKTHNIRYTFYFLFAMMILPIAIYSCLNLERGRQEANSLEQVEADDD